jgi:pyruvate kinase
VATSGFANHREGVLEGMLTAVIDVVWLNFSHDSTENHRRRLVGVP